MTRQEIESFIQEQYGGNVDKFYNVYGSPEDLENSEEFNNYLKKGGSFSNPGFQALPNYVQRKIKSNMQRGGSPFQQYLQKYPYRPSTDTLVGIPFIGGNTPDSEINRVFDLKDARKKTDMKGRQKQEAKDYPNVYDWDPDSYPNVTPANRPFNPTMQMGGDMYDEEFIDPNQDVFVNPLDGFKKGGININPANKGKFTAKAKRAGMSVQGFANKVLKAKEGKFSASTRRQANFAKNASKWKKQEGGAQEEQLMQLIQMYSQITGEDPQVIIEQLQSLQNPQEQQAFVEQIVTVVEQAMAQQQQGPEGEYAEEEYAEDDMSPEEMYAKMGGYLPPAFPFQGVINDMYNTEPIKGTPAFYKKGGYKQIGGAQNQPANTTQTFTDNKMQELLSAIQGNSMGAYQEQAEEEANQMMMAKYGAQLPKYEGTGNSQVSNMSELESLMQMQKTQQDLIRQIQELYKTYGTTMYNPAGGSYGMSGTRPGTWQMMNVNPYYAPYSYRYRDNLPFGQNQQTQQTSNFGRRQGMYTWNRFLKDLKDSNAGLRYEVNGQTYIPMETNYKKRSASVRLGLANNPQVSGAPGGSGGGGNNPSNNMSFPATSPMSNLINPNSFTRSPLDPLRQGDLSKANSFKGYNALLPTKLKKSGGEMYLTEDEIQQYRRGGYTIEYLD